MPSSHAEPTRSDPALAVPWEIGLISAIPLPPFAAAGAIAGAMIAAFVALRIALDLPVLTSESGASFPITPATHLGVIISVIFAYVLGAVRHVRAGLARDLRAFTQQRGARPGHFSEHEIDLGILRRSRWWGLLSSALGCIVILVMSDVMMTGTSMPVWRGIDSWSLTPGTLALFWVIGRVGYWSVQDAGGTVGFHVDEIDLDLLQLRQLDVFGQIALRFALNWIIGLSIFLVLVLPFPDLGDLGIPLLPVLLGVFGIGAATFILPVLGVHRRIRETKHAALAALQEELSSALEDTLAASGRESGRLTDLLTWRSYLENLREWPFDFTTVVTFALYLLIPVASWIGGAVVERIIDLLLD